jgi:hypothetical protein
MTRRLTDAFKRLNTNLKRAETVLDRFFDNPGGKPRKSGQPAAHEQELLRSVLVLAIGALDAYLSDVIIETLPRMAKVGTSGKLFDRLASARPGLVLRAYLVGKDNDIEREIEKELAEAIEAEFAKDSMHGSGAALRVSDWCALGLGRRDFDSADVSNPLQLLDDWTDKRHRIVHRGELVRLKRADATEVIKVVRSTARVVNDAAIRQYG